MWFALSSSTKFSLVFIEGRRGGVSESEGLSASVGEVVGLTGGEWSGSRTYRTCAHRGGRGRGRGGMWRERGEGEEWQWARGPPFHYLEAHQLSRGGPHCVSAPPPPTAGAAFPGSAHHPWVDHGAAAVSVELGQLTGRHVELESDGVEGVPLLHSVLEGAGGSAVGTKWSWGRGSGRGRGGG